MVGLAVGDRDGENVGDKEGVVVGKAEGFLDGVDVGEAVGMLHPAHVTLQLLAT